MQPPQRKDPWASGAAYEPYVGRWSRVVACEFITWLAMPPGARWLDVGCGTAALSQAILDLASPDEIRGIDPSESYLTFARQQVGDRRASFRLGDAHALPEASGSYDAVVAGLVLNFVPQPSRAVAEMGRVARVGGTVAAYVWDYGGQMQLIRYFWDAAVALDPAISDLDEGQSFPICQPEPLLQLFRAAGLREVEGRLIDIPTAFRDFEDYWSPFLGGQGPAPGYAMSLAEERRHALRERLRATLPMADDGSIQLIARAWAVRGVRASL
jgi:SAM-dependent methyltransferase